MERKRPGRAGESASTDDKLAATMRTLEEGITSLLDRERFVQYLRVMSRFHHYSFGNVMLI